MKTFFRVHITQYWHFQRVTIKQYWLIHSTYETVFTLSQNYYQTIVKTFERVSMDTSLAQAENSQKEYS